MITREIQIPKEPRLHWKTLLQSPKSWQGLAWQSGRPNHDCFLGRNAIYHGLKALGIKSGENILVPAFHCRAAIEPITAYGSEIKFYDVNTDLSPNFQEIERKIDQKSRGVLIIHYFGFPQPVREWQKLCKQHQLYLIEDCAHVLTGRTPEGVRLGEAGDISIFSWRKFLPTYDGGRLVINNPRAMYSVKLDAGDFVLGLKAARNTFDRLVDASLIGKCFSTALSLPSSLLRSCLTSTGDRITAKANTYDVGFDSGAVNLPMTSTSRRILQNADFSNVVSKRRENYRRLAQAVSAMMGVAALFPNLPDEICPWIFPMLVQGIKELQPTLRAQGIPVTSWSEVVHGALPITEFPNARLLYEDLLFLPVHQSIGINDLEMMISILDQTVKQKLMIYQRESVPPGIRASDSKLWSSTVTQ